MIAHRVRSGGGATRGFDLRPPSERAPTPSMSSISGPSTPNLPPGQGGVTGTRGLASGARLRVTPEPRQPPGTRLGSTRTGSYRPRAPPDHRPAPPTRPYLLHNNRSGGAFHVTLARPRSSLRDAFGKRYTLANMGAQKRKLRLCEYPGIPPQSSIHDLRYNDNKKGISSTFGILRTLKTQSYGK